MCIARIGADCTDAAGRAEGLLMNTHNLTRLARSTTSRIHYKGAFGSPSPILKDVVLQSHALHRPLWLDTSVHPYRLLAS